MNKKMHIIIPIIWSFTTMFNTFMVIVEISEGNTQSYRFVVLCATALLSGAAAVIGFIRYKRSKNSNKDE